MRKIISEKKGLWNTQFKDDRKWSTTQLIESTEIGKLVVVMLFSQADKWECAVVDVQKVVSFNWLPAAAAFPFSNLASKFKRVQASAAASAAASTDAGVRRQALLAYSLLSVPVCLCV